MCKVLIADESGKPVSSITVNRNVGIPVKQIYGKPYLTVVDDHQLWVLREQTSALGWSCKIMD